MTAVVLVSLLALGLAILLFAPVRVSVDVNTGAQEPSRRFEWRVRWLVLSFGGGRRREPKAARERKRRSRAGRGGRRVRSVLATPGFGRRLRRLAGRLSALLWPRTMEGVVVIGLDDPAATGVFYGQVQAIAPLVPVGWRVRVEPDFSEPVFEARGHAEWAIPPASVLGPVVAFLASPVVWKAAWNARRRR